MCGLNRWQTKGRLMLPELPELLLTFCWYRYIISTVQPTKVCDLKLWCLLVELWTRSWQSYGSWQQGTTFTPSTFWFHLQYVRLGVRDHIVPLILFDYILDPVLRVNLVRSPIGKFSHGLASLEKLFWLGGCSPTKLVITDSSWLFFRLGRFNDLRAQSLASIVTRPYPDQE